MKEQILGIIREIKNDNLIDENVHLVFDGIVSSLELLQLIAELEKKYEIMIPVEEVLPDNFDTIDGISLMVKRIIEKRNKI